MVGQNIGKYRVHDRLGRGGMGTVYRAVDETLHRDVAIKVLNAGLNDPSVARRFRAEAVTVARLNHPGIATIYELFQHEGQWLMVMEFVRGETLEALVTRKGPLGHAEAADLSMQALAALAHAHSLGVVHRDLKPANIMLTESGAVKVMDFGIARVVGTEHLTSAGFMMGTPAYMAPEQVLGEDIDARADLYAMGVVLYHLVTGQLPFRGNTPFEMAQSRLRDQPTPVRTIRAELPDWLGTILQISLNREPVRRFQSAAAFREALRRGLSNLPLETPESSIVPPELVATAAPSTMPIASGGTSLSMGPAAIRAALPRPTPSPAADPGTLKSPAVAPSPMAAAPAVSAPSRAWTKIALVAGVLVASGLLVWMRVGGSDAPTASPAPSTAAGPSPPPESAQVPAPEPPAGSGSAGSTTPSTDSAAAGSSPAAAASSAAAGLVPTARPAGSTPAGSAATGRSAPPAAGGATGDAATAARGGPARGRGNAPAADPPLDFQDARLLVVVGRRAEEQPGVLNFGAGRVAVVSEQSGETLRAIPYAELTYALYTRGKDPKWSPALAAPPGNVDLPSGLFSPARHWLALQSRGSFLIVRLGDSNWRQVLQTVTARTGLQVQVSGSE